ncbi:UNVERIFIED_CONTAM: hypothetical protein FKN15_035727 [Acipenser sinensis]
MPTRGDGAGGPAQTPQYETEKPKTAKENSEEAEINIPTAASIAPDNTQTTLNSESTAPGDTAPLGPEQPPELQSTVSQLKESLSLMEVELVELREMVLAKL